MSEIENDFSAELPMAIGKLKIIRDWFDVNIFQEMKPDEDDGVIFACLSFLENAINDFEKINAGLYGSLKTS